MSIMLVIRGQATSPLSGRSGSRGFNLIWAPAAKESTNMATTRKATAKSKKTTAKRSLKKTGAKRSLKKAGAKRSTKKAAGKTTAKRAKKS